MAITLPTGFQSDLEESSGAARLIMVFELELAAGTLYYSDQNVTWNGNDYTPLVVSYTSIVETLGPEGRIPEMTVIFDNVEQTLEDHITPDDLIFGERLIARLLSRDQNGDLRAGSIVRHIGQMQHPKRGNDRTIAVTSFDLARGVTADAPPRVTSPWCQVHVYGGDGTGSGNDCNYVKTGTIQAGVTSNTVTVTDSEADDFDAELSRVSSGIDIPLLIGADVGMPSTTYAERNLTSVDTGANTITFDGDPLTVSAGWIVKLKLCDRFRSACAIRYQEELFQGFEGVSSFTLTHLQAVIDSGALGAFFQALIENKFGEIQARGLHNDLAINTAHRPIRIGYGRRRMQGDLIEQYVGAYSALPEDIHLVRVYAISEGEIEEVVAWFDDSAEAAGERYTESDDSFWGSPSELKRTGIYYRPGSIGVDDDETEAEYRADTGDNTTWKRSQNRDLHSNVETAYSRTAYVTFLQTVEQTELEFDRISFDVKLKKLQEYDSGGSPTVEQWSRNPIWQVVDFLTNTRYGLGRLITASDIDFSVTQPSAATCDETVDGAVATTETDATGLPADNTRYQVDSTRGFYSGLAVIYNSAGHPNESDTVVRVLSGKILHLETGRSLEAGSTITAKTLRYTSDLIMGQATSFESQMRDLVNTCRGYLTYNEDGKIQVRLEEAGASVATYADTGFDQGYALKDFRWLEEHERDDPEVNRVFLAFVDEFNEVREAMHTRFDHLEDPKHVLKSYVVSLPAINNYDSAQRIVDIIGKRHGLGQSCSFTVGPIGLQHQVGDIVTVSSVVGGLSSKEMRIRKLVIRPSGPEEFLVDMTCEDYDSSIYGTTDHGEYPETDHDANVPSITLTLTVAGDKIRLEWATTPNSAVIVGYSIFKSDATMGTTPGPGDKIFNVPSTVNAWEYAPEDGELGIELFFIVGVHTAKGLIVYSSEGSIVNTADPTTTQFTPGSNTVYDGGFEENPTTWTGTGTLGSPVSPEQDYWPGSPYVDSYINPENARDGDEDTFANCAVNVSDDPGGARVWRWTSGGSGEDGLLRVVAASGTTTSIIWANQHGKVSADNGATFYEIHGNFNYRNKVTIEHPMANVDRTQVEFLGEVLYSTIGGDIDYIGQIHDIYWVPFPSGAFGYVANGRGVVQGNGAGSYGFLVRPWPALGARSFLTAGESLVTQIRVAVFDTPSDPLHVQLRDGEGTYYDLIGGSGGIPETTLDDTVSTPPVGTWTLYVGQYTVPAGGLQGPFRLLVRTLSTEPIFVENLMIERGTQIHEWAPHPNERDESLPRGQAQWLSPRGPWTTDLIRSASVLYNPE